MRDRWETEILQHEVPKIGSIERARERWDGSNDAQTSSSNDTNRSMTAPQRNKNKLSIVINYISNETIFLAIKPLTTVDSHTVPSSRFTRPSTTNETNGSPPSSQTNDIQVFSRVPLSQQKNSNSNNAIETLTRQINNMSAMNGNDTILTNGQPAVVVKDTKITPSIDLNGVITRAKDCLYLEHYTNKMK